GTFDLYFDMILTLRSPENPRFLVEIIEEYLADSARVIARLEREIWEDTTNLIQEQLDNSLAEGLKLTMDELRRCLRDQPDNLLSDTIIKDLYQLKASSSSLGGGRVDAACVEVGAIYRDHRQSCLESFKKLKKEYEIFSKALIVIEKMEVAILKQEGIDF
ncbi:hypothetical protein LINPERHAP2_LOCUS29585, partial [Linum perenne]